MRNSKSTDDGFASCARAAIAASGSSSGWLIACNSASDNWPARGGRPSISNIDFDQATRPCARSQFHRPHRPRLSARSTWPRIVASARARACARRACRAKALVEPIRANEAAPSSRIMISAERRHGRSSSPTGATKAIWPGVARRLRTAANSSSPSAPCTLSAPALSARMVSGSAAPSRDSSGAPAASGGSAAITTPAPSASSEREGLRSGLAARTARSASAGAGAGEAASASSRRVASAVAKTSRSRAAAASARSRSERKCSNVSPNRAKSSSAAKMGGSAGRPGGEADPMSPRRGPVWPPLRSAAPQAQVLDCRARTRHRHPPKLIAMRPGKPAATTRITSIRIPVRIFVQTLINR